MLLEMMIHGVSWQLKGLVFPLPRSQIQLTRAVLDKQTHLLVLTLKIPFGRGPEKVKFSFTPRRPVPENSPVKKTSISSSRISLQSQCLLLLCRSEEGGG